MAYAPDAIFFDGTNDYMTRGGRLTSVIDGRKGAISVWLRRDDGGGVQRLPFTNINTSTSLNWGIKWEANEQVRLQMERPGVGPDVLNILTSPQPLGEYIHLLSSWDIDGSLTSLYVNDVSDLTIAQAIADDIAYDSFVNDYLLGTLFAGSVDKWPGAISELWFNTTEFIDFDVEANRRKFIDDDGLPVDPGLNGELPTGTSPAVYLRGDQLDQGINTGTGGNFVSQSTQVPGETPGPGDIPGQVIPIGLVTELDFAFDTLPVVNTFVDLVNEFDLAQIVEVRQIIAVNFASELNISQPINIPLSAFVDQVLETDNAFDIFAVGGLIVFVTARLGQPTVSRIIESKTSSA